VLNVALTGPTVRNPGPGPNTTGGYQLDARFGTLQSKRSARFLNHAQVRFTPSQQILDDLAAFQSVIFSDERVRALSMLSELERFRCPIRILL